MHMPKSVASLDAVEGKALKYGTVRTSGKFVRGGAIFEQARNCAQLTREEAAAAYGTTPSLLSRQVFNEDHQHLSFHRMCEMPATFQREAIRAWAAALDGVRLRTVIEIEEIA